MGLRMLAHSMNTLGTVDRLVPGQVVAWLDAVDAVVGADRLPGSRGEGGPQVGGQAVGGSDDRVVDAVSNWFEDGEAASVAGPPSAWMDTAALACAWLPMAARR